MAEYTPLASPEDVVEALGRALTPTEENSVSIKLAKASELFRTAAGRTFVAGRSTQRLRVHVDEVNLADSPVDDVHSVTDDSGNPLRYTLTGATLILQGCSASFVRVDYSHGNVVPELARTTVAEMVARVFDIDKRAASGMTQYQTSGGPYSESGTFAPWAIGGQIVMSPADTAAAESLRRTRAGGTIVLRS